jgi:hypothetical protein
MQAAVMVDPERFEIGAKSSVQPTLAGFVERSSKYSGGAEGVEFERKWKARFRDKRREIFDAARDL